MAWIGTVFSLIGGGWGSAVAVIALIGAVLYFKHLYTQWKQEQAIKDGLEQATHDQQASIDKNTEQGKIVDGDSAQSDKDKQAALDKLNGGPKP